MPIPWMFIAVVMTLLLVLAPLVLGLRSGPLRLVAFAVYLLGGFWLIYQAVESFLVLSWARDDARTTSALESSDIVDVSASVTHNSMASYLETTYRVRDARVAGGVAVVQRFPQYATSGPVGSLLLDCLLSLVWLTYLAAVSHYLRWRLRRSMLNGSESGSPA